MVCKYRCCGVRFIDMLWAVTVEGRHLFVESIDRKEPTTNTFICRNYRQKESRLETDAARQGEKSLGFCLLSMFANNVMQIFKTIIVSLVFASIASTSWKVWSGQKSVGKLSALVCSVHLNRFRSPCEFLPCR